MPADATTVLPWRERPPRPARPARDAFQSPVVRRLLADHDLDPATITGTGAGGRVTRADVLEAVGRRG
ncbi:MAG: E3 binding domain-containing protein, partial [Acidimicrobiia bacterium]